LELLDVNLECKIATEDPELEVVQDALAIGEPKLEFTGELVIVLVKFRPRVIGRLGRGDNDLDLERDGEILLIVGDVILLKLMSDLFLVGEATVRRRLEAVALDLVLLDDPASGDISIVLI
jgi:hypothetical protein